MDEINEKGLNAPRLTPEKIDSVICGVQYHIFNGKLTVCCLTLSNGFLVTGESSCVSLENFDKALGEVLAYANARDKIWTLEGYLLQSKLSES